MLQYVKIYTEQNWICMQQSDLACKHLVIVTPFNIQLAGQNADFTIKPSSEDKNTISASNYKRWNAEWFHCTNGSEVDSV